jgi:hypothetical protein
MKIDHVYLRSGTYVSSENAFDNKYIQKNSLLPDYTLPLFQRKRELIDEGEGELLLWVLCIDIRHQKEWSEKHKFPSRKVCALPSFFSIYLLNLWSELFFSRRVRKTKTRCEQ